MPHATEKGANRAHALGLSVLLALAAAVGLWAVMTTQRIGSQATKPQVASALAVSRRSRQLEAWRAALERALRARPPALPPVPRYAPVPRVPVVHVAPLPTVAVPTVRVPTATPTAHPARVKKRAQRPTVASVVSTPAPASVPAAQPGHGGDTGWSGGDD